MRLDEPQWSVLAKEIPEKQLLAFRLIYSEGLSQQAAANTIGISQQAIANLLSRLKAKYPECVPKGRVNKMFRLNLAIDDNRVKEKY